MTVEPLTDREVRVHAPDLHLTIADGSALSGRCSCWWTRTPALPAHRVGLIGHYAAATAAAGASLLSDACQRLAAVGCTIAVGPMDGNTWRRYRFVTERGTEPPFFLEPDNADDWPAHWRAAGFAPMTDYTSALNDDLSRVDPRIAAARNRLSAAGVTIRTFNPAVADAELHRMFVLSLRSFSGNFLYSPIDEAEFLEQNRALLPAVRTDLVLLAERAGELIGLLFAVPDALQAGRGAQVDTIIVKTVAVLPGMAHAGLGSVLVAQAQATAKRLGFTRAIHALMHERNVSQNISRRYARPIRRYQLFARPLGAR